MQTATISLNHLQLDVTATALHDMLEDRKASRNYDPNDESNELLTVTLYKVFSHENAEHVSLEFFTQECQTASVAIYRLWQTKQRLLKSNSVYRPLRQAFSQASVLFTEAYVKLSKQSRRSRAFQSRYQLEVN